MYNGAKIQESLLQSYRKIQFGTQSIFLLIGFVSTLHILDLEEEASPLYLPILHFVLTLLAMFFLFKIRKVILARATDVDYWHLKILQAEQKLKFKERHFTHFKIQQKLRRKLKKGEFEALYPTKEDLASLIGKRKGHTRKVLDDQLAIGFAGIWLILALVMLISL